MSVRTTATSLLVAAALVVPGGVALADGSADAKLGAGKAAVAKAKNQARKLERLSRKQANRRGAVVLGGTLAAVTPADPAVAGSTASLAFTVHGGRYKPLRGEDVTVTVAPDAKVTRGGVVTLAELLPGDHVVVKSRDFVFSVVTATDAVTGAASVSVTTTATVTRVVGSPAGDEVEAAAEVPAT